MVNPAWVTTWKEDYVWITDGSVSIHPCNKWRTFMFCKKDTQVC